MFCFNAKQVACAGLLAIGLCIFAAPNAARAEDDPAAMEKAMELLAVSGAKTMFEQMIPRISQQIGILVEQVNPGEARS